jgi:hypothetical protein
LTRKLIAGGVTLVLLASAGLFLFLASIPARFGRQVGAGFASVEQSLCVLDRDGTAAVIVAGDSRAKSQVVPAILADSTGLRCVNVAEDLDFGGDLTTLVNALRKNPRALDSHPLLLISVSLDGINDYSFEYTPMAALANYTPSEHLRLALRKPLGYPRFFATAFLPFLRREAGHMKRGDGFACDEDTRLPEPVAAALGYRPIGGPRPAKAENRKGRNHGFLLDGARWRLFQASLEWLADSPAEAVVLYNAPIDHAWLERASGPEAVAAEKEFSALVAAEARRHAKTVFWDFNVAPEADVPPGLFHDPDHLIPEGARIFSAMLARRLTREFPSGKNP